MISHGFENGTTDAIHVRVNNPDIEGFMLNYCWFTPTEAREFAEQLIRKADLVEQQIEQRPELVKNTTLQAENNLEDILDGLI